MKGLAALYRRMPEFFEGDDQRLSMTRLVVLLSLLTSSCLALYIHTVEMTCAYITAYVVHYACNALRETYSPRPPDPCPKECDPKDDH